MFANLTGWHMVIILAVVLLLFGAPKLPALAKSMGQSMRIFKGEVKMMQEESADSTTSGVEENRKATADAGDAASSARSVRDPSF